MHDQIMLQMETIAILRLNNLFLSPPAKLWRHNGIALNKINKVNAGV